MHTHTHTHNHITALWTLSGTTRVSRRQKVHFAIWIFWSKKEITQADAPTTQMDCHPIQVNWCPHLCHFHHFYAGCPSLHNPPNLSWLGTSTKYAALHTRWLGWVMMHICFKLNCNTITTTLHSFSDLFSRTTWVSRHQKSRTILVKPIWIYWSKR